MKRIGFTGTQIGMTAEQEIALMNWWVNEEEGDIEFHHGDCIGADASAHTEFKLFRAQVVGHHKIVGHPPDNDSKRAFCDFDEIRRPYPYLTRNKHIVEETELLIACPKHWQEEQRSGTWSTIRYARKLSVPITIIMPDGSIIKENH